jgi:hypothetical protein
VIGNTDSTPARAGQERIPDEQHASAHEHFRQGREELRERRRSIARSAISARRTASIRLARSTAPSTGSCWDCASGAGSRRSSCVARPRARSSSIRIHYLNLARLHLAFGFKAEGLRLLKRGLMIAPDHEEILDALRSLGVRKRPPLGFLRRENALNRWLGKLIDRTRAATEPEPAPTA